MKNLILILIAFTVLYCNKKNSSNEKYSLGFIVENETKKYYQSTIKHYLSKNEKALVGITMEKGIDTAFVSIYWVTNFSHLEDLLKDYVPIYKNLSDSLAIVVFDHIKPIVKIKNEASHNQVLFNYVVDDRNPNYHCPMRDYYPISLKFVDTTLVNTETPLYQENALGKSFAKHHKPPKEFLLPTGRNE